MFVDNRPEAYPPDFFRQTYIPMQSNENVWKKNCERFGFQAVYFYRHDFTRRAQQFLERRLKDPEWALVFADNYALIFAKRGGINQAAIDRVNARHILTHEPGG